MPKQPKVLPDAVRRFFTLYPTTPSVYQTYNGSVFPTEETAQQSVSRCTAKRITRYDNPAASRGKKN